MSHQITPQHPAVVLRSHYVQLRALLAVATVAVVGLTVAVVTLATNDAGHGTSATSAAPSMLPVIAPDPPAPGQRHDGGPEEGTSARSLAPMGIPAPPAPGQRFDGGPEEGASAIRRTSVGPTGIRHDGGPDEGTRGPTR
jgi:hypothetical protein